MKEQTKKPKEFFYSLSATEENGVIVMYGEIFNKKVLEYINKYNWNEFYIHVQIIVNRIINKDFIRQQDAHLYETIANGWYYFKIKSMTDQMEVDFYANAVNQFVSWIWRVYDIGEADEINNEIGEIETAAIFEELRNRKFIANNQSAISEAMERLFYGSSTTYRNYLMKHNKKDQIFRKSLTEERKAELKNMFCDIIEKM